MGLLLAAVVGGAPVHSRQTPAIPRMFEENRGQFSAVTRFLTRGNGYHVSFASSPARIFMGSGAPARNASFAGSAATNSLSTITQEEI
jgi:hypothetical protein